MLWDTHMHTHFSGDSEALPEDMIRAARQKGLGGLCFTDHLDLDYPEEPDLFLLDIPAYYKRIKNLQELLRADHPSLSSVSYSASAADHGSPSDYGSAIDPASDAVCASAVHPAFAASSAGNSPSFDLLWGIEIGLQPHLAEKHNEIIRQWPFDQVIGSSHVCHGQDPYYPSFYEGKTEEEAYREYFESELENIACDVDFDVYGHIDYVVRYGPNKNQFYSYQKYADILDEVLKSLISRGKGIEINTGGFRSGLGHPNPTEDIIRRYRELGGEFITIGADAHNPADVAYAFDRIPGILKDAGFDYFTVFRKRKPEFIRLDQIRKRN